jgi:hypothetical protein
MVQYIGVERPKEWRRLGGNPMATASGAFALRQSICVGHNTHVGGNPITSMTNTIIIL